MRMRNTLHARQRLLAMASQFDDDYEFDSDETQLNEEEYSDLEESRSILSSATSSHYVKSSPANKKRKITRQRQTPLHLKSSVVTNQKKATKENIKVSCNQTGKCFKVSIDELSKENGEDLNWKDLFDGNEVIYESKDGKTYDVKIVKDAPEVSRQTKGRPAKSQKSINKATVESQDLFSHEANTSITRQKSSTKAVSSKKKTSEQESVGFKRSKNNEQIDTQQILDEADGLMKDHSKRSQITAVEQTWNSHATELLVRLDQKMDTMNTKLVNMEKKIHDILQAKSEDKVDVSTVMWEGCNLLDIQSKDANSYARLLLDKLFTKKEQMTGILFQSKISNRLPLDPERVKILFSCLKSRYNNYDYSSVQHTLNQKCRDAKEDIVININ
ncbi:PREDICTED: uncharacterized protein LOC109587711 [Amphimedon queenslandica]|uniref:BEN domain-containing protein n=1 Tax=Amphimedon queenslandica TaxID=400682 RepID=A0AAN0JRM2_AMPQE|nr:PREDICTED: uncharacterized protein LOC109587711 [Amphimedon queenslandica]|eukprot:XP_019859493.1 PREDICTED: uncharacterized protein LOC109587711 [Amphimedon queenslandica]